MQESKQTKEKPFTPIEREKKFYHVELDKPLFNKNTGEKLSIAYVQTFSVAEWKVFEKTAHTLGYTTKILWNPEEQK